MLIINFLLLSILFAFGVLFYQDSPNILSWIALIQVTLFLVLSLRDIYSAIFCPAAFSCALYVFHLSLPILADLTGGDWIILSLPNYSSSIYISFVCINFYMIFFHGFLILRPRIAYPSLMAGRLISDVQNSKRVLRISAVAIGLLYSMRLLGIYIAGGIGKSYLDHYLLPRNILLNASDSLVGFISLSLVVVYSFNRSRAIIFALILISFQTILVSDRSFSLFILATIVLCYSVSGGRSLKYIVCLIAPLAILYSRFLEVVRSSSSLEYGGLGGLLSVLVSFSRTIEVVGYSINLNYSSPFASLFYLLTVIPLPLRSLLTDSSVVPDFSGLIVDHLSLEAGVGKGFSLVAESRLTLGSIYFIYFIALAFISWFLSASLAYLRCCNPNQDQILASVVFSPPLFSAFAFILFSLPSVRNTLEIPIRYAIYAFAVSFMLRRILHSSRCY